MICTNRLPHKNPFCKNGALLYISCLIYFPSPDGLGSMHPVPHNSQYHDCDKSIIFWLNSYDSEYEMKDLITYEEAVNEVIYFLQNDDVSANLSWEPD